MMYFNTITKPIGIQPVGDSAERRASIAHSATQWHNSFAVWFVWELQNVFADPDDLAASSLKTAEPIHPTRGSQTVQA